MIKSQRAPFVVFCMVTVLCGGVMLSDRSGSTPYAGEGTDTPTATVRAGAGSSGSPAGLGQARPAVDGKTMHAAVSGSAAGPTRSASGSAEPGGAPTQGPTGSAAAPGSAWTASSSTPGSPSAGTSSSSPSGGGDSASPSGSGSSSPSPTGGGSESPSGSPTPTSPTTAPAGPPVVDLGSLPTAGESNGTVEGSNESVQPGGNEQSVQPQGVAGPGGETEKSIAPAPSPAVSRDTASNDPEPVALATEPETSFDA